MEVLGVIAFVIALVLTPVYLLIFVKGVRSLSDIRDMFKRPPGDYGDSPIKGGKKTDRKHIDE
ncbi:hypothetical protein L3Q67_43445 [Saccharothrix sp. AJ9571]|nr:hypothetical protein L3Q67_43445 [Saccharothrix sp. AJ9571]